MVIYNFDILFSILFSNLQAFQAQLEQLRPYWVCQWAGDHQESSSMCSQERHGGRTLLPDQVAPDSMNSRTDMAPELQGERPQAHVRCTPPPCLSSVWHWEALGLMRPSAATRVSGLWSQACAWALRHTLCLAWAHTCSWHTHTALRTVLTLI